MTLTVTKMSEEGAVGGDMSLCPPDVINNPGLLWNAVKKHVTVEPVPALSQDQWEAEVAKKEKSVLLLADPQTPMDDTGAYMRVVCISDTHSLHDELPCPLPPGHLLLHAGDFTNVGKKEDCWSFCAYLGQQKQFEHRVVIAGNHDVSFDKNKYLEEDGGPGYLCRRFHSKCEPLDPDQLKADLRSVCTYLEDEHTTLPNGLHVSGCPWQPEFYGWGFNVQRGEDIHQIWRRIPTETDILLTHGPPLGHGDKCQFPSLHVGCANLLAEIERIRPKLHVFGHIHEGYGVTTDGRTVFVNASSMQAHHGAELNPPIVLDVRI